MGRHKGSKDLPDDATERVCSVCNKLKPFSEFSKNKNTKFGISCRCKLCDTQEHKKWRSKEGNRDIIRSRNLQHNFGITLEEYENLLVKQQEVCAICGKKETRKNMYNIKRLGVDHNHKTNKIRGLLCSSCNQGLGMFYVDDKGIDLLLSAIEYMRKNNE